jgi:protein-S-isoprenylcysteine O-methyltransferase Ste14
VSSPQPRWLDFAFAASSAWWALAPALIGEEAWAVPVRIALMALHLEVALLFLLRGELIDQGKPREFMMAMPSLILGGFAFKLSPPPADWPLFATIPFIIGVLWTAWSLATLGKSFAILPAVRACVSRGPYRLVRHPIYLGESMMFAACIAAGGGKSWWLFIFFAPSILARIYAEEQALMRSSEGWREYSKHVRWRIIPKIF